MNETTKNSGLYGGAGLILGFIIGYLLDTFVLTGGGPMALIFVPPLCMFAGIMLHRLSVA